MLKQKVKSTTNVLTTHLKDTVFVLYSITHCLIIATITGSPAGLSRVNGVRRSSAKHETSGFAKVTILYKLI